MNSPLITPRKRNRIPDVARISSPRRARPSTYSVRSPLPPTLKTAAEVTQQQFVDNLTREVTERLSVCNTEHEKFLEYREIFGEISYRYGPYGCIKQLKDGYDEIIDFLEKEINENNKKVEYVKKSTTHIDTAIIEQQQKLEKKREKYKTLFGQLDFSIGILTKETDEQTTELLQVQKEIRALTIESRSKAARINELSHEESEYMREFDCISKEKESLNNALKEKTDERDEIKNTLTNYMDTLYQISTQLRDKEVKAEEQRTLCNEKKAEYAELKKTLDEARETEAKGKAILKQKNDEFDRNKEIIQKLTNMLQPKKKLR